MVYYAVLEQPKRNMFSSFFFAAAFQVLPFYQQDPARDFYALRPFWSREAETTDVLWPLFTSHRDWWRFAFFVHGQTAGDGGYQFEIMPFWWNGREGRVREDEAEADATERVPPEADATERVPPVGDSTYWGLFPLYGRHPHILLMYDWRFCLWPLWMQYRTPRPKESRWMTSNVVLFPFVHWRDDGSWGFWPLYSFAHNRADDHTSVLWPIWNWKTCLPDRDTGGAGSAWMLWPLAGRVDRERERQWLFLPPLFSYAETKDGWRLRCPLPFVEVERLATRARTSVFPFYEHIENLRYVDRRPDDELTRFGWRLVELLPDETRVFPFWVSRKDGSYFRLWPFWESSVAADGTRRGRFLSLFPIRWVPAVDRNWAKFWTLYEREEGPGATTRHSLLWGLIRWTTENEDE